MAFAGRCELVSTSGVGQGGDKPLRVSWARACCAPGRIPELLVSAIVVVSLAACVTVKTEARGSQTGAGPPVAGGEKLGIMFSSDASPELPLSLGYDAVECLVEVTKRLEPPVSVLRQEQIYTEVFPGLDPKQVLIRADTIPLLVNRPAIRERLERLGLRYLVLVGGAMRTAGFGRMSAPGGIPGGFLSLSQQVTLTASVFELHRGAPAGSVEAAAGGTTALVIIGVLPLGGGVDAEASACQKLGEEFLRMVQKRQER